MATKQQIEKFRKVLAEEMRKIVTPNGNRYFSDEEVTQTAYGISDKEMTGYLGLNPKDCAEAFAM